MPAAARCSECSEPLVNADGSPKPAGTKTCGDVCRNRRSRRKAREKKATGKKPPFAPEHQDIAAAVRGQTKDLAHEVIKEQLGPVVREAMTKDVLRSIDSMVKLTPAAITLLEAQLDSEDETIAQRAATLIMKYTLGNPSVAPPSQEQAPAPMSVVFQIPRPGDATTPEPADVELRTCTDCNTAKQPEDFVGASPRCQECFDGLHATLRDRFAVKDETAPGA